MQNMHFQTGERHKDDFQPSYSHPFSPKSRQRPTRPAVYFGGGWRRKNASFESQSGKMCSVEDFLSLFFRVVFIMVGLLKLQPEGCSQQNYTAKRLQRPLRSSVLVEDGHILCQSEAR